MGQLPQVTYLCVLSWEGEGMWSSLEEWGEGRQWSKKALVVVQEGQQTEQTDIVGFVMKRDFHAHKVALQENRMMCSHNGIQMSAHW